MKSFLVALKFLTAIPVKTKEEVTDRRLAESMAYFPLVGLFIGISLALAYNLFDLLFPHRVNCAFIMILNILISGGLHIDGFIDTTDAIASRKDRKRMLEIMHEGRPGAVGIASVIVLFLARYSLLISLPKGTIESSLISMSVLSRWSLVVSSALYPYARDEGLGKKFIKALGVREITVATFIAFIIAILIFKLRLLILLPGLFLILVGFNTYINRKLGGITGDTLGALNEIVEVLTLALAIILI